MKDNDPTADALEGLEIPGCGMMLTRSGGTTVFSVSFEGSGGLAQGFHAIACDGEGLLFALSRDLGGRSHAEAVEQALADPPALTDETTYLVSRFGALPDNRTLDGMPIGDMAIWLVERVEAIHPRIRDKPRTLTVPAAQRRMLAAGLSEVVAGIGPDRIGLWERRQGVLDAFGSIGPLRMPAAAASALARAGDAYPAIARNIATGYRRLAPCGDPHADAVQLLGQFGFEPAAARGMLRRIRDGGGPEEFTGRLAWVLGRLPLDWVPASGASGEWRALLRLSEAFQTVVRITDEPLQDLVAASGGRWSGYARHLADAAGVDLAESPSFDGPRYGGLYQAVQDVDDLARDCSDTLVRPLLSWLRGEEVPHGEAVWDVQQLLFSGRGLARILAMSARWHRAGGVPLPAPTGAARGQGWEPVLPGLARGDLRIVPLADRGALADEGAHGPDRNGVEGLAHCVGGYWQACIQGRTRIMGVRRIGDGVRVSTFEVGFSDPGIRLAQHAGRGNAAPPPEATGLVEGYMAGLTDGSIPFDPRPCAEARRNGGEIPLHLACGYDWRDEDRLYRAIEAWAPYLARPLRGLSPERFAMAAWGLEREADAGPRP